jgi:hypothetical protein
MELLIVIILVQFFIIYRLYKKPPEIVEKERIIERIIEKDAEAEEKAKYNEYYRIKQNELNEQLQHLQQQKISELQNEISEKKVQLIKGLENELYLYESEKENKMSDIDSSFELFKLKIKEQAQKLVQQKLSIQQDIDEWKNKHNSAIETFKQLDQLKSAENFNRIILSSEEKDELEELNAAIKKLRNPMPFYKAIFDIYYKNKINDLVLRVVGSGRVSGIYKITEIESGRTYVGQSVDIGDRWKQHAKRGCGADAITNNKLYPAMRDLGLDKFQFEVVEITNDTNKLNELEKYWQEFFQSKEFGYSMK